MNAFLHILAEIGFAAVIVGCAWLFSRWLTRERRRPKPMSDWRDCDCGDFPSVTELFHSSVNSSGAQRDHA